MPKNKGNLSPREQTDNMVRWFKKAAGELFPASQSVSYWEFEKGLYAYLIVKPIKRIARLVSVDRELLVLFSSFFDQQYRTLEVATDLISKSEGRLEQNVIIIVHADPDGNSKLKNWGREKGLAVIPISTYKPIPIGDALEQYLFSEFFSHDAFDVSGPVSDDTKFYGRRSEAQDIARQLQSGQIRSCLGIRKTGKTSIIHRILDVTKENHDCYSVMIDCSRDSIWQMSEGQLLESIAIAVEQAVKNPQKYASTQHIKDDWEIGDSADHLLQVVTNTPRPVLIFFDEVDYITPGSPTSPKWVHQFNIFWRNLRASYQEAIRNGSKVSLFISGVSSKWFRIESIQGIENAALAFIPEEYLVPLQSGASIAMIKTLARTSGLVFERDTADYVAGFCSNVPYWIRKTCSFIHRNIPIENRPHQITDDEVRFLTDRFAETEGAAIAEVALNHLFRVYPELENIVVSIYRGESKGVNSSLANVLEKYGVIAKSADGYRISGNMVNAGMHLYLEKAPISNHQNNKLEFDSLEEWAEELALMNAKRNKIEKRMRALVLNFIRYDVLQNKQKGTLFERLIKYIEEPRRTKLKNFSPDELVEKYNWSDLVKMIEKEWNLFQGIFIDKTIFSNNSTIINDRYDAHAKDADKADVALYRRALEWYEESLGRT
jgi:hypothetical protein